ncbi:putative ankyrin repeat protein RF_0381 [Haliotis asinina]|uniref:putative ankyrin repeat protein RF_0381 n=1 Tax=Haliotis asinina TaxID=109174 RepID=UPI003532765B
MARAKFILSYDQENINSRGKNNMTPVMYAAQEGHEDVFDLLVREGANLTLFTNTRENILHVACIGGSVEIVKCVLTQNIVDINSQDGEGFTPLMNAAFYGRKYLFYLLAEEEPDFLLLTKMEETILHVACAGGNVEIVKYLMKHNIVDTESRDKNGWTPVMQAAYAGRKEVFHILVEAGANMSQVSNHRETILHISCKGGNVEITRYLMKQAVVDIESQDYKGWTPVMQAASAGHKHVFDILVEAGADLSHVGHKDDTILHVSCKGENVDIIKYLLTHEIVDIDSRDLDGWTSVMQAAIYGHKKTFDVLVEAGADLSQVHQKKKTFLHLASEGGNVEIIKHVLSHVSTVIDSRDVDGWTPVMHTVRAGHKDAFNFLAEKGADLSKVSHGKKNILHLACDGKNVEIIKYLLKHGIVDIDSRDKDGLTPLMHTAKHQSKDAFDILVKWGADLLLLDDDNDNILHLACDGGSVEIVKYLLTHNIVDINSRDGEECTPRAVRTIWDIPSAQNQLFAIFCEIVKAQQIDFKKLARDVVALEKGVA